MTKIHEADFWKNPSRRLDGMSVAERLAYRSMPEPNSGCRLWLSATDQGYGIFSYLNKKVYAHRAAYELSRGPIPDGLHVCHRCDNPGCINPDHMFLGTPADNLADMRTKGRGNIGPKNGACKLGVADVLAIRRDQRPAAAVAVEHGVSAGQVRAIRHRVWWKHIDEEHVKDDRGKRLACRKVRP